MGKQETSKSELARLEREARADWDDVLGHKDAGGIFADGGAAATVRRVEEMLRPVCRQLEAVMLQLEPLARRVNELSEQVEEQRAMLGAPPRQLEAPKKARKGCSK